VWAARALTALLCTVNAGRGLPRDRSAYADGARDTLKNVVAYVALTSKRLDMLCRDRRPHAQQCKNCAFSQACCISFLNVLSDILQ
jgi:hypothetical protein